MGIDARVFAAVNEYDEIEWNSGHRWFDASYTRGHWPTLRQQITTLQEKFPEYPVYYLPADYCDRFERGTEYICTPERIAYFDQVWAEYEYEQQIAATVDAQQREASNDIRAQQNPQEHTHRSTPATTHPTTTRGWHTFPPTPTPEA